MPAQQRLGLDQDQRLTPAGEHRRQRDEEQALPRAELRLLQVSNRHDELLAEEGVLDEELLLAAQKVEEQAAHRPGVVSLWGQGLAQILPGPVRGVVRQVASLLEEDHARIKP